MKIDEVEDELGGEWLLPVGNGGYGSGRLFGPRSRSYHGLLVAALPAPLDRMLVLAQVDECITSASGADYLLAAHRYADGSLHPRGDLHLVSVGREGREVRWRWRAGEFDLERCLRLGPGNRGRLIWTLHAGSARKISLRPFVTFRSHHGGAGPELDIRPGQKAARIGFDGHTQALLLESDLAAFRRDPVRHENINLVDEELRGLNAIEALDSPGEFVWEWPIAGSSLVLDFRLEHEGAPEDLQASPGLNPSRARSGLRGRLDAAMRDFLVQAPGGRRPGLIAGYPWFNEWGRDSMIALPGLAVALGDSAIPLAILEAWAERLHSGLLPNRLAEGEGAPSYNSADAPLWFLNAAFRFWRELGSADAMPDIVIQAARQILESYHAGTDHGIGVDQADGLVVAGDATSQLTWMDARFGDEAITPRHGKCVELQALYHAGHSAAADLELTESMSEVYRRRASLLARSFAARFPGGPGGGLHDCVDGDLSLLRPNQLFALGSGHPLLGREERARALKAIEPHLLTPMGLRSLGEGEPGYRGRYRGGPEERDRAYHQGTVWAWLFGPWGDAVMRSSSDAGTGRSRIEIALAALALDLDRGLHGQIAEIFDGDAPHLAVGAPAQAWSLAEFLRLIDDHDLDVARIEFLAQELAS